MRYPHIETTDQHLVNDSFKNSFFLLKKKENNEKTHFSTKL